MTAARLGSPATLSPDQARAEANRIKDVVAAGGDPGADRKAAISKAALERASTVERAVADYLAALPTKGKKGGGRISDAWAREQANHLHRAVAALGVAASPVESVDVKTVRRLQQGEAYRHRFGALNRFFDWCVHEGRITANPCASIGRAYRPAGRRRARAHALAQRSGADLDGGRDGARAGRSATSCASPSRRRRAAARSPISVGSIWTSTTGFGVSRAS